MSKSSDTPISRRLVRVEDCGSSWDFAVQRDPFGSLRDWAKVVRKVEDLGLFPRHGLSISLEIARVTRPPIEKQEPLNLFFQFYFKGTPAEASQAANNFMQVLRRIVRESGLEHARMSRQ